MTRAEFYENVTTWRDLINFCSDEQCLIFYDEEGRDDYINSCLMDWAQNDSWTELLSRLGDIPTGYDYYRYDDYGEWEGLDDGDFDEIRDEVAEWMDDNGYWDDEEEVNDDEEEVFDDDENAPFTDPEDAEPIDDEDCSLGELFEGSAARIQAISEEELEAARETERALRDFLSFTS
mgnify:CR=1 FL=1